jgi:hypothetical protein
MQRTPTFIVEGGQQTRNLDALVRRNQHFDEDYRANKPLCFHGRAYQKTHPSKVKQGRTDADATLVSPLMLGVADGVSQIEDFGIDPSELPHELLNACHEIALEQLCPDTASTFDPYVGPIPMMRRAFDATESLGSTTVLLGIMDNSTKIHGKLHPMIAILSIGDCELLILRRTEGRHSPLELIFHTEMQRIDGNAQAPLQVARVDDRVDPNFEESITHDVIYRGSSVHCMSAYEGDIIISGSDGVFDNLFLDEVIDIANQFLPPVRRDGKFCQTEPSVLEHIARTIVAECHRKTERGHNGEPRDSPIGLGGKVDDTCCVVGEVVEWTKHHSLMWSKAHSKRSMNTGILCSLSNNLGALGRNLFGGGLASCGRGGSDYGSDYGSEFGDSEVEDEPEKGANADKLNNCNRSSMSRRGGS